MRHRQMTVPFFGYTPMTPEQQESAVSEFAMKAAEFSPGSGEYIDFQDTLKFGREAYKKLKQGNIVGALQDYSNAFVSSVGTIPLVAGGAEIAQQLGKMPRVLRALNKAEEITREPWMYAGQKYLDQMGQVEGFHGSPYTGIRKLSNENIGTGQGAQTFGYGHYITEEKGIAKYYQDMAFNPGRLREKYGDAWTGVWHYNHGRKQRGIDEVQHSIDELKSSAKDWRYGAEQKKTILAEASRMERLKKKMETGSLAPEGEIYKATAFKGKKENFIDWYKPVPDEISDKIFAKLTDAWKVDPDKRIAGYFSDEADQLKDFIRRNGRHSGQALYKTLELEANAPWASALLKEAGVDGIQYPAGSLSGMKSTKKNYVIFDPSEVELKSDILELTPEMMIKKGGSRGK